MTSARNSLWVTAPVFVLFLLSLVWLVGYYVQYDVPELGEAAALGSNLGFFLLINLNIIVVLVLAFLVMKNIAKLILDRQRNIFGARLRTRLVVAFVALSLVPTVLLFLTAKGILGSVLQGWFSPQIAASVDGAVGVAKYHYDTQEAEVYRLSRELSQKLSQMYDTLGISTVDAELGDDELFAMVSGYLDGKREEYGFFELTLVNARGEVIGQTARHGIPTEVVSVPPPNKRSVKQALEGNTVVRPEQSMDGEFLRGYAPIHRTLSSEISSAYAETSGGVVKIFTNKTLSDPLYAEHVLVATHWISPELNEILSKVIRAFSDYQEFQSYRRPLESSYLLTLIVVTLMIIFAAIWVGFYLARGISVPIQSLAEGTEQIAHGNLEHRIPEVGDDELSVLVKSFNDMTEDLQSSRDELIARRRYMETVLANVGVGVVSLHSGGRVTTCNLSASEMLQIGGGEDSVIGASYQDVLPEPLAEKITEMFQEIEISEENVIADTLSLYIGEQNKNIQITTTKLVDENNQNLGAVVLLDDLTELVNAQRIAAWREVARRIAHEIKNPLTPIQLSAQRIQRKVTSREGEQKDTISVCAETIVSQVDTLRNLVDEFSRFAKMPKASPKPIDLNLLIEETTALYREGHAEISFYLDLDKAIPVIDLDREQIGRVLVNLVENAVASVQEASALARSAESVSGKIIQDFSASGNRFLGEIRVASSFDANLGMVSIQISDSGLGISDGDKPKVFEPYFSKKRGGTGLGLAIVSTIIADHHGFIRVRDNQPRGARFIVELPVTGEEAEKENSSQESSQKEKREANG